jgi:hypothetical protein
MAATLYFFIVDYRLIGPGRTPLERQPSTAASFCFEIPLILD